MVGWNENDVIQTLLFRFVRAKKTAQTDQKHAYLQKAKGLLALATISLVFEHEKKTYSTRIFIKNKQKKGIKGQIKILGAPRKPQSKITNPSYQTKSNPQC